MNGKIVLAVALWFVAFARARDGPEFPEPLSHR